MIVPITGDWETDVKHWTVALDRVFGDINGAFCKASSLRSIMAGHVSWVRSAAGLLGALESRGQSRASVPVTRSNYIQAALHLSTPLDVTAVNRSADMIRRLSENRPENKSKSGSEEDAVAEALVEQYLRAYRSDNDLASHLAAAQNILRIKYSQMKFEPDELRREVWEWRYQLPMKPFCTTSLRKLRWYIEMAKMVSEDIASIPEDVLEYSEGHGIRMHAAVRSGQAITFAEFGCPRLGELPYSYALENLERIFEAAHKLVSLDLRNLDQGYLSAGKPTIKPIKRISSVVALAFKAANGVSSIPIMSAGGDGTLVEEGRFVARLSQVDSLRFVGGKLGAADGGFLYRWGATGPTPEIEWKLPVGSAVNQWFAIPDGDVWQVFIEDCSGRGTLFYEQNAVRSWSPPYSTKRSVGASAMWVNQAGEFFRAYILDGDELIMFRGYDDTQVCSSVFFRDVTAQFSGVLRCQDYIGGLRSPYRLDYTRFGGRDCLVIYCILDPGSNAVFFLDAGDLSMIRPPLVCKYYFEEARLVNVGSHTFFMATLMARSRFAFAVWDVTGGSGGQEPPIAVGCPNLAGAALDCECDENRMSAWFTVRRPLAEKCLPEVWRWRWPGNVWEKQFTLPEGRVGALAVRLSK